MKKCPSCGNEINVDAIWCMYCHKDHPSFREKLKEIMNRAELNYVPSGDIESTTSFSRAIFMDDLNYYGIINGKQIMCMLTTQKSSPALLRCLKVNSDYKPSPEGTILRAEIKCTKSLMRPLKSFIASMEILPFNIPRSVDMWADLKESGMFPYWDPTYGPDLFARGKDKESSITIFRAYEVDLPVDRFSISAGEVIRTVENPEVISADILKAKREVLNDDEYNGHREKIREIVNKYKTSYE